MTGSRRATAGRPISSAIEHAGLTDVLVAVVRYFGGTKLGTVGLARAYRGAAALALAAAGSRLIAESVSITVSCRYESAGAVRRLIQPPAVCLSEDRSGAECLFRLAVWPSWIPRVTRTLQKAKVMYRVEKLD